MFSIDGRLNLNKQPILMDNSINKEKMIKNPLLSVIIPTYNEEKNIAECIRSLKKQSYKHFEIIVVDDGSTDKTREIVKNFRNIKLIEGEHKGPGFSRNIGAEKAKGEILIFIDSDMTFHKDYLKNLIKPIVEKDKVGAENEIQIASNFRKNIWTKCFGKYNFDSSSKDRRIFRAIKKKEFLSLGGFDPKYGYADDQTLFFKYRMKPSIAENSICYHKNPENLKQLYKQNKWIGASINNIFLKMPIINYLSIFFLVLSSPITISLLSIKKCQKNRDFKLIFPWMLIFITVRYFGIISGITKRVILGKNTR